ncbi:alpha/beta hydrolase [Streptomyces fractus]|uniref:alpha/beta hydrolase n=1 Tax=Streptomyces fractus TaxID=641806 RepID=UPI003CF8ED4C
MPHNDDVRSVVTRMMSASQVIDPAVVTDPAAAIRLWPGTAPGSEDATHEESAFRDPKGGLRIRNVVVPTLTPYLPEPGRATGAAVIVAPGGGFLMLSMDNEGTTVAEWLRDRGVTAFLLKYRLDDTGPTTADFAERSIAAFASVTGDTTVADTVVNMSRTGPGLALEDTCRAVALVRERAADWNLDANRIGLIGFSAGGFLATNSADAKEPDERPDFIACVYGGYAGDKTAPDDAPPLFVTVTVDDAQCFDEAVRAIRSWRAAKRPVEAHIYPAGSHGFGLNPTGEAVDSWPDRLEDWLRTLGHLA